MWHKSQGTLKYYPYGDWWIILECCEDLRQYYTNYMIKKLGQKPMRPKNGSHISVVRGEGEPKNKENWLWNDKGLMDFEYSNRVVFNFEHAWLPVRSEELTDLRLKLGLSHAPEFGFHLTLGRIDF